MRSLKKITLVFGLFAFFFLSSFNLTSADPKGPSEILIGAARSMTGMFAGMGQGGEFGFNAAVDDINRQGGLFVREYNRKIPVKVIMVDTESDTHKFATLAADLILRNKVRFLTTSVGTTGDFVGVAILADRHKIPYISVVGPAEVWAAVRSEMKPPWEYSWGLGFAIGMPPPPGDFRNKPGYTNMDTWMGMIEEFGDQTNKKAALFASDESAGRGFYGGFAHALQGAGIQVLGAEKEFGIFPLGTNDFTSLINRWKEANCEILWGNCPAPEFGTLWRQCRTMGYKPKIAFAGRAALYYTDVSSWGGDLPYGIGCELQWAPSLKESPGIGSTTPESLAKRWRNATKQPINEAIGWDYSVAQVLFSAIERAGSLNGEEVNKAIKTTDIMTIRHRVLFDETHFNRFPLVFGQWVKTNNPGIWEHQVVYSKHKFFPVEHEPIFPIP